ncbi:MAG: 4-hydroxy-3-methylbut-2-en-1-yl diphosphate synthase [Bacteroidia bacterium]|nr:MAG: 4-hydroxy-3-methylbut-2-en-1-yl diphosphate synthase [Bacteroidia bacterium]
MHIVKIGNIELGHPEQIITQSMTSVSTMDTQAIVEQVIKVADAGGDMVRITARNVGEAQHLQVIKDELSQRGYHVPLVADIHFSPATGDVAATIVEKIRINPGNYLEKKTGKTEWTAQEDQQELDKLRDRLSHLVDICKAHNTAIRVGVNHGSLSQRIVFKHGDTPEGMAESAMEFVRVFRSLDFHDLVISLKSSNVVVMVEANKILYQKMQDENAVYPLHLGVTEAGSEEDGRIKSAAGIGALLAAGIGNTIRVSLTEDPECEIPVALDIIKAAKNYPYTPVKYASAKSAKVANIGHAQAPVVMASPLATTGIEKADWQWDKTQQLWLSAKGEHMRPITVAQLLRNEVAAEELCYLPIQMPTWSGTLEKALRQHQNIVLGIKVDAQSTAEQAHRLLQHVQAQEFTQPIVLQIEAQEWQGDGLMVNATVVAAPFLLAGQLDGLLISHAEAVPLSFGILQATRRRITQTEYISCPSCGRTLFAIQDKLRDIKAKTAHLKGLKIAVMGCIVNGPGEMADADYGYVGAGSKKVHLYKGQQIVRKNVDEDEAADALLEIINEYENS